MSFEWKIYARDQNYQRQGEIDEYREATFTPVYNDVGTWEIVIDRRSDQAAALTTPGWGIMLTRDGAASRRSEERRVGKECRSRWSPYH